MPPLRQLDVHAPMLYILNADGEPERVTDAMEWALWYETADRRVAGDRIGPIRLSTVFLSIEHFGGYLYETLAFDADGDAREALAFDRYHTREQAEIGHAAHAERLRRYLEKQAKELDGLRSERTSGGSG